MRTSFFSPAPVTAETLKKDVRMLADDTLKVARQQVVEPTMDAARRARAYANDALQETRDRLSRQVTQAERYASAQYDQTARWVITHPLKSVGIALAIGVVLSSLFSSRR
ncbi:YqjD family protein [Prosthecobacter sp.]|uniref:YqjD family protein n=1 Tax=Prosthecobacter sp. TaxID=1965333 RepID=UPI00378495D0